MLARPSTCVGVTASMRPRRVRLGWIPSIRATAPLPHSFNEAEARAPRMANRERRRDQAQESFNEAEARAPRMASMTASAAPGSTACFNEAEARAPRMDVNTHRIWLEVQGLQ